MHGEEREKRKSKEEKKNLFGSLAKQAKQTLPAFFFLCVRSGMGSHSINDLVQAFAPNNGERLTNSINIRKDSRGGEEDAKKNRCRKRRKY